LFFATLFLGLATAGLVVVAYNQMREARSSINAAVELAKASKKTAEIAQRTFVLTNRPRIRVRQIFLSDTGDAERNPFEAGRNPFETGHQIEGIFEVVNIGSSLAMGLISRCHVLVGDVGEPIDWPIQPTTEQATIVAYNLEPGVNLQIRFKSIKKLEEDEANNLRSFGQNISLIVMGRIYQDEAGNSRGTGFCRRWTPPRRFLRIIDPDFEYED
jgi:hypothetical protein